MKSSELGLSAMYRILKKAGANRVSDESADELRRTIEEIAEEIAKSAVDLVAQTKPKRVTITGKKKMDKKFMVTKRKRIQHGSF